VRPGRPSLTAAIVSFARGVSTRDETQDPLASELVSEPFAATLRGFDVLRRTKPAARTALRVASAGLVDHISYRTFAIDRALVAGLRSGIAQVVILGAGLDARAHRLPELEGAVTFEVDHPATQAFKRARTAALRSKARVVYVPVDFERDTLREALGAAGHRAEQPTIWIWEGVTMYLERRATLATLGEVSAVSAASSVLLATYVVPDLGVTGALRRPASIVFRVLGEELRGVFEERELHALLEERGFEVASDTDSRDWACEAGRRSALALLFGGERLVVARRVRALASV
jgi:methyltransferase (TIGR00027 family)